MAAAPSAAAPFSLRRATAGDFDAYMDAFEAVAAEGRWMGAEAPLDRDARRSTFDRAVAGDGAVQFLAEAADGAIVGGVHAGLSGGVVDLGMFVVAGRRGGGVGSALLEVVIDWARAEQAHKISLAAWPTNHPAIGLYARYGFRIEGVRRRHYRRRSGALWDATVMGLILDDTTPGGPGPDRERPSIVVPDGGLRASSGSLDVALRPWRRADIAALVPLVDEPHIRRWLDRIPDPYTAADAEEYVAGTRVALTAGTQVALAVVVDGALAGSIDLRLDAPDGRNGEVGYWVAAGVRGRGVAPAAVRLLVDFGFGSLGLRRVQLNAAVDNAASRRVAEKAGFELEGVRRAYQSVHGVPTDFALYSRI
ncbi:MAG TPA: GNAT family N-acetyltransferase [Acidimicrobiia bacterium]|nr:GNAT family N-acetyltransferase [Acidimicrobiia bacterium]